MPVFRVYFMDADGRTSGPPEILNCTDDQEATEKSRQFVNGRDLQLWEGARLVAKFAQGKPVEPHDGPDLS